MSAQFCAMLVWVGTSDAQPAELPANETSDDAQPQDAIPIDPPPTPPSDPQPEPAPEVAPPAPTAPPRVDLVGPPTTANVHLYADYPGAWLELKSAVDPGPWRLACHAPCDRKLEVEAALARVAAPGMATSNVFRIDPGAGTAHLKVSGGSALLRQLGILGLAGGLPVTLAGAALYGYGFTRDEAGFRTAGAVTLAVGTVSILAALPMLIAGSTTVRDARGGFIALDASGAATF